jgi:3-methylcrotonyl-CoA carboxylase alpha subunit
LPLINQRSGPAHDWIFARPEKLQVVFSIALTAVALFTAREGESHEFRLYRPGRYDSAEAGSDSIVAPMPGMVRQVSAEPGAQVEIGALLVVLEAMKMEHTLRSPRSGVVAECLVAEGDQVESGAVLMRLAPEKA